MGANILNLISNQFCGQNKKKKTEKYNDQQKKLN